MGFIPSNQKLETNKIANKRWTAKQMWYYISYNGILPCNNNSEWTIDHKIKWMNFKSICYVKDTYTHTEVAQSCATFCGPMDCSPPGSSVHGIFQGWILELPFPSPGESSWARDQTWVSRIIGRQFTIWATREVHQKHRRVVVSFKRMSVEIFYRWNLLPRSQLANYMHSWRQEAAKRSNWKISWVPN